MGNALSYAQPALIPEKTCQLTGRMPRRKRGELRDGVLSQILMNDRSWLYTLFVAIDANFRLTRKHVSNELLDPSLGDGWAFFVKNEPYHNYLAEHWNEPQPVRTHSRYFWIVIIRTELRLLIEKYLCKS